MLCAKFDGYSLTTFKVSQKTVGLLFCGQGILTERRRHSKKFRNAYSMNSDSKSTGTLVIRTTVLIHTYLYAQANHDAF